MTRLTETKNYVIMKLKYVLFVLSFILGFSACTDEDTFVPGTGGNQSEGYMKIQMNLPEFKTPTTGGKATRAMSQAAEKALDPDKFSVLVFKYNESGGNVTETFWYKAPLSGGFVIDADNPSKAEITVKLVKSESSNDKFRIVIVANHDITDVNMVKEQTSKTEIYSELVYNSSGKWNADDTNPTLFPMWGESAPVVVVENMDSQQISLYRALARIDVGLGFIAENNKLSENAEGIENFSLKEIKVYRTYDKGAVAPLDANYRFNPTIPSSATKREDNNPLAYALANATGGNAFVREIYVPEANLPASPNNDNMHCLVIGGYYRGSTTMTYYRLDFAKRVNTIEPIQPDEREYFHILRNHRYIFNITEVMGPGFNTVDEALKSHPTIDKIGYDLIVWDETIHEMEIQGKYYFGLDQRDLIFEAPSSTEDPNNVFNIKYQTNYLLNTADPMTLSWKSEIENPSKESPFTAVWDPSTKGIKLTAKKANETNKILSDSLIVKAGPFTMKVHVQQKYINFKYTVTCETVVVTGTYKRGGTLNANADPANPLHYIDLSITADDKSIEGYSYILETDTVNGISFRDEGKFDFTGIATGQPLVQKIRLIGTGTIDSDIENMPFTLKINSNSSSGSYCEATITPVITKLRVLTIANSSGFGYDIGLTTGGAYKVITSPNNFGTSDNSIVKVDGFTFERAGNNFTALGTLAMDLLKNGKSYVDEDNVTRKYLADILYVGHDGLYNINAAGAQTIVDYMKMGGVVIFFNEGAANNNTYGPATMVKTLFSLNSINVTSGHMNGVIPFAGNDLYKTGTEEEWNQHLYKLQTDPVLNGPFGNLIDKQWGEDASHVTAIDANAFPTQTVNGVTQIIDDITIYSYYANLANANPSKSKDYVSGFKYETDKDANEPISFVYFGDGGFVSSNNNSTGTVYCPFWWNTTTMFPIPKDVNGRGYNGSGYPAYNSQAFCNSLAWAVQRSADLYRKREAAMGR